MFVYFLKEIKMTGWSAFPLGQSFCDGIALWKRTQVQHFLKYEEPSLQHGKYGFLPMQRSSKYNYWYSFKLKNELHSVAVIRVQQNERLFIALILSSAFVDIKKLLIYCTYRVLSNNRVPFS